MRYIQRSTCFFFNDTATTEIYTLSLHDALPIYSESRRQRRHRGGPRRLLHSLPGFAGARAAGHLPGAALRLDRKSTRLNSSHDQISYAVFCLQKKNTDAMALDSARSPQAPSPRG